MIRPFAAFSRGTGAAPRAMIVAIASVAAALAWLSTQSGVGLSPDSRGYVSSAHVLARTGTYAYADDGPARPVTAYPPGYPAAIAMAERLEIPPVAFCRALDVALAAISAILITLTLAPVSNTAAYVAALGIVLSPSFLEIHSMAWSEPPFIALMLAHVLALIHGVETQSRKWLAVSAIFAAGAYLTRFVGLALIVTAPAIVLWEGRRTRRKSLLDAATFLLVATIGPILWTIRNRRVGGQGAGRALVWHPVGRPALRDFGNTLWNFATNTTETVGRDRTLAGLLFAAATVWVIHRVASRHSPTGLLVRVTSLTAAGYMGLVVVAMSVADQSTGLDRRILSPLLVLGIIAVVAALTELFRRPSARRTRLLLTAAVIMFLGTGVIGATNWVKASRIGIGFNSPEWRTSELVSRVCALPPGDVVFSNAVDAIRFRCDRDDLSTHWFPQRYTATTGLPNASFSNELSAMADSLPLHKAAFVAFSNRVPWRTYFPTAAEIQDLRGIRLIAKLRDGSLYQYGVSP